MAHYSRKVSLRQSFNQVLFARKSAGQVKVNRLKGRHHFRAAVRLVREYMKLLTIESATEDIPDDVTFNIRIARLKSVDKKLLNPEDRTVLLTHPVERSKKDRDHIWEIFKKSRAFRKYNDESRESLVRVCLYQYVTPDRVIVRQNRPAENLYFIVDGEVTVSRIETDKYTGELKTIDMGNLSSGDMFGEVALLHEIPRTATVISKTDVELLLISRDDFNEILKEILTKEWNVLQDALVHFDYFKGWNDDTIRECCILSRIKDFKRDEIVLGDGKGKANLVHFILDGECRLIEHIFVRKRKRNDRVTCELYYTDEEISSSSQQRNEHSTTIESTKIENTSENLHLRESESSGKSKKDDELRDASPVLLPALNVKSNKRMDVDRMSIVTTTLQDVINEWHAITDLATILTRKSSLTSQRQHLPDVYTVFMDVCVFRRGTCFGLGEEMRNRRIVAATPVKCLLIPRYWLLRHNRANIWERVKLYMESKYPSRETLFQVYINDRKWKKYKTELVEDACRRNKRRPVTNVTIHDVPYSTRIREGFHKFT